MPLQLLKRTYTHTHMLYGMQAVIATWAYTQARIRCKYTWNAYEYEYVYEYECVFVVIGCVAKFI